MIYRFVADVPLRWVDVDSEGVVNNAVYLSLMEEARFQYFDHLGLLQERRVPFLLAEATVTFLRPGRIGMKTEVAVRTRSLGTSSFQMDYEVRAEDHVLATGQAALVFVDGNLRPVPIPAPVREAIQVFEDMPTAN
ncbi:MAG: acyl-CoA thioesterase [Planctomycetes bacterium]|nr:acyl-CoA thioesterase [Planctomycetota bacterium]MCC7063877.1 acyl-CoA thioesterase [Planctomycetota bacterium]